MKDVPTYKRQRALLELAGNLDESVSSTEFQKLMFLRMMETGASHYDFVPYLYGPYSFQLAEDVITLRKKGFLLGDTHRIQAAKPYQTTLEELTDKSNVATERGDDLVRKVYREYPYYTINSTILWRLFRNDSNEMTRLLHERDRYKINEQVLFTIGYEGRSLESFFNTLLQNGVHALCDVRKNALSRKYGFSREKLEQVSHGVQIKYFAFPDLGIESDKRKALANEDDYRELFSDYAKAMPTRTRALNRLYEVFQKEGRIALMCYEKQPEMCHRHVIRDWLCANHPIRSINL